LQKDFRSNENFRRMDGYAREKQVTPNDITIRPELVVEHGLTPDE